MDSFGGPCSVGVCAKENCHKERYGGVSVNSKMFSNYNNENHEKKYLHKYFHLFGQNCCDPLKIHSKVITKGLKEITFNLFTLGLIPGKGLLLVLKRYLIVTQVHTISKIRHTSQLRK
ncbi:hypothetical protein PR048_011959 [Dryococelus australis]|uniref:Uncharacterized protein n=1 Tax=Dryococelus australis TaxID=614101 RepID=A0ABQ9HNN8_9NEOP|nr:hypothetical protein PR048_011959 [Dryococelus australis]